LHWSCNEWNEPHDTDCAPTGSGHYYADVRLSPAQQAPLRFTFFWTAAGHWEGRDFQVLVEGGGREQASAARLKRQSRDGAEARRAAAAV
jgi:hypothetical protein